MPTVLHLALASYTAGIVANTMVNSATSIVTNNDWPLIVTLAASVIVGFGMVVLFGYASNQRAIKRAKAQIQGNLLAVRLFQDQISAVLKSYVGILTSLGRYLRLSFAPLLIVIVPLTLLITQMDRYLGNTPISPGKPFLVKAHVSNADTLSDVALQDSTGLAVPAQVVRVPAESEVIWRVDGLPPGEQTLNVVFGGISVSKNIVVGNGMARLSSIRMRQPLWKRWMESGEPAIETGAAVESIEVLYPPRDIAIFGFGMGWLLWFFVFSIIAGFIFKSLLGIEI